MGVSVDFRVAESRMYPSVAIAATSMYGLQPWVVSAPVMGLTVPMHSSAPSRIGPRVGRAQADVSSPTIDGDLEQLVVRFVRALLAACEEAGDIRNDDGC